jgi:hypothetical protein
MGDGMSSDLRRFWLPRHSSPLLYATRSLMPAGDPRDGMATPQLELALIKLPAERAMHLSLIFGFPFIHSHDASWIGSATLTPTTYRHQIRRH